MKHMRAGLAALLLPLVTGGVPVHAGQVRIGARHPRRPQLLFSYKGEIAAIDLEGLATKADMTDGMKTIRWKVSTSTKDAPMTTLRVAGLQ